MLVQVAGLALFVSFSESDPKTYPNTALSVMTFS